MIAELGTFALILALCLAILQAVFPLVGAQTDRAHFITLTRSVAYGQFVFITFALGLLVYLFIISDFSVTYVATNSNTKLPLIYKISAVWGAHEGSLLLWMFCLSLWTVAVTALSRKLPELLTARVIGVMGLIAIGFLLFILVTSNPFAQLSYDTFRFKPQFFSELQQVMSSNPGADFQTVLTKYELNPAQPVGSKFYAGGSGAVLQDTLAKFNLQPYFSLSKFYFTASEGKDLNPLLQDFGLAIHPPILYMGYVGFSVAFAFAIGALMGRKLDSAWARWSRPWTTIAWVFMTMGIALGSWWAYYELGWGGWWFWDPVENASFMPWLLGTALIHSLAVTEKRGTFQSWTVILAILAFSHSLLGTFLVRSGILNSVHAFTSDPARGMFILGFLIIVIGGSLTLYSMRAKDIKSTGRFNFLSREAFLLTNNVLFFTASVTVLWGTLYPILYSAFGKGSMSVGKAWFDFNFVILMLPLAVLTGIGPLVNWKQQKPLPLLKRLLPYSVISVLCGLFAWTVSDWVTGFMALMIGLSIWITSLTFEVVFYRYRKFGNWRRALFGLPASITGMMLAHTGLAVFIIGTSFASYKTVKADIKIAPGENYTLNGFEYRFKQIRLVHGPNFNAYEADFDIYDGTRLVAQLKPQKRFYTTQRRSMTEAGIDPGFTRDLFISMGDPLNASVQNFLTLNKSSYSAEQLAQISTLLKKTPWVIRFQHKPFVRWIWLGALFMALGGLLSVFDKRYRFKNARTTEAV